MSCTRARTPRRPDAPTTRRSAPLRCRPTASGRAARCRPCAATAPTAAAAATLRPRSATRTAMASTTCAPSPTPRPRWLCPACSVPASRRWCAFADTANIVSYPLTIDGVKQVVAYNIDTAVLSQLTFDAGAKDQNWLYSAPRDRRQPGADRAGRWRYADRFLRADGRFTRPDHLHPHRPASRRPVAVAGSRWSPSSIKAVLMRWRNSPRRAWLTPRRSG
jgi:hypothetical protein